MDLEGNLIDRVQRDHPHVILEFLGESVGQAGESVHVHPHCEVLTFDAHHPLVSAASLNLLDYALPFSWSLLRQK